MADATALAMRFLAGDQAAGDALAERLAPLCLKLAVPYHQEFGDLFELDDLVQECYLAAVAALNTYRQGQASFATHAYKRMAKRLVEVCNVERQRTLEAVSVDPDVTPDTVPAEDGDDAVSRIPWDALTPGQRVVVEATFGFAGGPAVDANELGRRLGMSGKTVSVKLKRALQALRDELENQKE